LEDLIDKTDKKSSIEDLKRAYSKLKEKYALPEFDFLNQNFDIELLAGEDSEILLKKIRKSLTEKISSVIFTRPADTTAYAIDDVVGNSTSLPEILVFSNMTTKIGASGYIVKARLEASSATVTDATFRLYLYNQRVAAINDNAAKTRLFANREKQVGHIDFALATEGTGSDCAFSVLLDVNIPFTTLYSNVLYGVLVAKAAYIPTSGERFFIELTTEVLE